MPANFNFLLTDVERQKEIAREALAKAEEIDQLLKSGEISDEKARKALEDSKRQLLSVASGLASNANATTVNANTVFEVIKSGR